MPFDSTLSSTSLRSFLSNLLTTRLKDFCQQQQISLPKDFSAKVEVPPRFEMGHYSSPVIMQSLKFFKTKPLDIAQPFLDFCQKDLQWQEFIEKTEIAAPAFLNFFIRPQALSYFFSKDFSLDSWLDNIFHQKKSAPVLFEFVSANPTGPLNIVSARAACVGDSICRLLKRTFVPTSTEYYVNDYGNQVNLLGLSFAYRFLQLTDKTIELPEHCYQGEYIIDLLKEILNEQELPPQLDLETLAQFFAPLAVQKILSLQKKDLQDFNVVFDNFFSEASLHKEEKVQKTFLKLQETKFLYNLEGAWFFKSTAFGDDKDRVVKRADGRFTYLMADIAYHLDKVERGYQVLYDIWGPDHHGYIKRLQASLQALGFGKLPQQKFEVLIVQQVNMLEDGKPVVMSKRLGKFQTMRDLLHAIPIDVSRYFFVARSQSSHLDFDLNLALTQSNQNPVYYIQYAHARIYSIFAEAKKISKEDLVMLNENNKRHLENFSHYLVGSQRSELFFLLLQFPEQLEEIANNLEIHRLPAYLYMVASTFTSFYHQDENRIKTKLQENIDEAEFLLSLCKFTAAVLKEGLELLGISAPQRM